MPVEQHRGLAGRAQPFGINQGIAFAFDQLRLLQPGLFQFAAHKFGGTFNIRLVFG